MDFIVRPGEKDDFIEDKMKDLGASILIAFEIEAALTDTPEEEQETSIMTT